MTFTVEQKASCVLWYSSSGSATDTQRKFRTEYGIHVATPSRAIIVAWYRKFRLVGSVCRKKRENTHFVRTPANVAHVVQAIQQDPQTSLRRISNQTAVSVTSAWRILKTEKFHPYKLQLVQKLLPMDHQSRVAFALAQINILNEEPDFLNNIIFSDEAHFHLNGAVNRHNFRYWSTDNPQWYEEKPLHSPRVTVWAAIGRSGIVGPFFFDNNVNGANYLHMLQTQFLPQIEHNPQFQTMVFQQDGAPPHWTLAVRQFLNQTFPQRWIGRDSPFSHWPPRSPDMTPMDFFLWGFLKSKVYTQQILTLEELKQRIDAAFEEVTEGMIDRAFESYERRLHRCVETNGQTLELW